MTSDQDLTGGCLCGGVRYRAGGKLRGVVFCHCSQCARATGHHFAATNCATKDFTLEREDTLRWYRSSPEAERGFCGRCGGNLFWQRDGADHLSITAGTLDRPTGLKGEYHIFCDSKSDYYEITDGLPRYPQWRRELA